MNVLNRDLQRDVLEALAKVYPEGLSAEDLPHCDDESFTRNIFYLGEHDLILCETTDYFSEKRAVAHATITMRGLDFLEDDGGLSAILGVVTVQLHQDTIRQLMLGAIEQAEAPAEEKSRLKEAIKNAPATAFSGMIQELAGLALRQAPGAFQLLREALSQAGVT